MYMCGGRRITLSLRYFYLLFDTVPPSGLELIIYGGLTSHLAPGTHLCLLSHLLDYKY